jgi:hypothetical protein
MPSAYLCTRADSMTGSGIAPFFPIPTQPAGYALPFHLFLFVVRVFFLVPIAIAYFLLLSWLPIGSLGKKAVLWSMLGVPGIWWIDLGVDGVKKGYDRYGYLSIITHTNVLQLSRPKSKETPSPWLCHCLLIHVSDRCSLPGCHLRPHLYSLLSWRAQRPAHHSPPGYAAGFDPTCSLTTQGRKTSAHL